MNQYRKDIDGIRAIAVVSVVLFHAGLPQFKNGFIGVDVFLVVSGFLIFNLIIQEQNRGGFLIRTFLERRARRILPALFLVLIVNVPIFVYVFSPVDIVNVFKSYLAIVFQFPNAYFWQLSGYFDPKAEFQPFLHTWSIGVEVQFYVLIGLLAACFLANRGRFTFLQVIFVIFIFSMISSIAIASWKSGAVFFLLPFRIWEFLAGSLVAINMTLKPNTWIRNRLQSFGKLLGLSILIMAIFAPTNYEPWPSYMTLFPVVGTCLMLYFDQDNRWSKMLLENKAIVLIGKVSFSWFLWHWPIITYLNYTTDMQISTKYLVLSSVVTFALAAIQWQVIEKLFRDKNRVNRVVFLKYISASLIIILIMSISGILTNGFKSVWNSVRLSDNQVEIAEKVFIQNQRTSGVRIKDSGCIFSIDKMSFNSQQLFDECSNIYGKAIVVIGDSHGEVLYDVISKSELEYFVVNWARPTSRPSSGLAGQYLDVFSFVEANKSRIGKILFQQSGSYLIEDTFGRVDSVESFRKDYSFRLSYDSVDATIKYLRDLSSIAEVIWMGPYVQSRVNLGNPSNWVVNKKISPNVINLFSELDLQLQSLASETPKFRYVSTQKHFKTASNLIFVDECIVWRDLDHFSDCGRRLIALNSINFLNRILRN